MENREALLNAGFENYLNRHLVIKTENTNIFVDPKDLHTEVYIKGSQMPTIIKKLKDLEDVKAFCYGHLGYYLDFTAKPKYDWKTVESKIGGRCKLHLGYIINTLNAGTDEGVLSKEEAQSMIAKLKLNIIVRQIDKDYPPIPTETVMGGIEYQGGELQVHYFQDGYSSKNSKVVTATTEGAQILLDQNPQLLKNLFKIETDATGED